MIGLSLSLWIWVGLLAQSTGPIYIPEGLVNAASSTAGPLAPNTLASLYGQRLAYATRSLTADDIRSTILPTVLPGTGVRVLLCSEPANLIYVSPTQINLLVPSNRIAGPCKLEVIRDGLAGLAIEVMLEAEAPQFFVQAAGLIVAAKPDGTLITHDTPAKPGDVIVLYATGLGRTVPDLPANRIATIAAQIRKKANFNLYLNAEPVERRLLEYVGLTPGFAGLYQINLRLPVNCPPDPEVRIGFESPKSVPDVRIAITP